LALVIAYRNWRALQDTQDCDSAWCTGWTGLRKKFSSPAACGRSARDVRSKFGALLECRAYGARHRDGWNTQPSRAGLTFGLPALRASRQR